MKIMKKVIATILISALTLTGFVSCGNKGEANVGKEGSSAETKPTKTKITLGSIAFNQDELKADFAIKMLEDKGYEVECLVFENATVMNEAIKEGSLDATLHEHKPWMENFNEQKGTDLIMLEPYIHYVEYSMMSDKHKDISELPKGAKISISDDGSNQERALLFLEELGFITLKEGVKSPTILDIEKIENDYEIIPVQHHQVVSTMPDVDACMTSTYLLISNNLPIEYSIKSSKDYVDYPVGFVIDAKNKDEQWVKDLMEAYTQEEMKDEILTLFKGGFIPGDFGGK